MVQVIGGIIVIVLIACAIAGFSGDDSPKAPANNEAATTALQPTKKAPEISVDGAKVTGDTLSLTSNSATPTISVKASNIDDAAGDTVTVNGQPTTRVGKWFVQYTYAATVQPGQTTFTISAKNSAGQTDKQLIVSYDPEAVAKAAAEKAVADAILEAEVTCQQYAEAYFKVKDINISYDQSSIRRQNPDGTILIKANIADANGWLGAQKPLGVMECTTVGNGLEVLSFRVY